MSGELGIDEVLDLARSIGVEVKETDTPVFKGGVVDGRRVVLIPKGSLEDESANIAILHELGHIKFGHAGSRDPRQFVLHELEANRWALTTMSGYPQEEWDWSILPGITEDLADEFGLSLNEAWKIARDVARKFGVGSTSLQKAGEELRYRE